MNEKSFICPYCRTEIASTDRVKVCPTCETPHHEDCWIENKGCTVYGCTMAPPDEEKISITELNIPNKLSKPVYHDNQTPSSTAISAPIFLYVPIGRLIFMSILSWGLYEAYWIYKNWSYLNERDKLGIRPFWRGFFPIFFCHGIFKAINTDRQLNAIEHASFSAGGLATGWVIVTILCMMLEKSKDPGVEIIASLLALLTFLFFIPVQNFINRVNARFSPAVTYSPWSAGHIVCIVWGILIWLVVFSGTSSGL